MSFDTAWRPLVSMIHSTPDRFGNENSQAITGIQIASAYIGSVLLPPLFGIIADTISIGLYPLFLLFFAVVMLFIYERMTRALSNR